MADMSGPSLEDVRLESLTAIKNHEIECEKRYGEFKAEMQSQRTVMIHLRRLVWFVLFAILGLVVRSFLPLG